MHLRAAGGAIETGDKAMKILRGCMALFALAFAPAGAVAGPAVEMIDDTPFHATPDVVAPSRQCLASVNVNSGIGGWSSFVTTC